MARRVLEHITPGDWDSQKSDRGDRGPIGVPIGFRRVRYLQQIDDTVNRPLLNRVTVAGTNVAVAANGAVQSTGIGTAGITPKRFAELTHKIRLTFNVNSVGPVYLYIYRTLGAVPANGAAPGGGDVVVGGDAFTGGPTASGVNQAAGWSFLDTGLDPTKTYKYYLAVKAPNANTFTVISSSHFVMERS